MEQKAEVEQRHIIKEKPEPGELEELAKLLGHPKELVATRSKYFKESGLDLEQDSAEKILDALAQEPRMLKRPIISDGNRAIAGFDQEKYREFFA